MGIISDTFEDNRERSGQFLSSVPCLATASTGEGQAVLACPICSDWLIDESHLQRHILDRHRYLHAYVKLNGAVLPEVGFIDQQVTDFTATLLGESGATVRLSLNGQETLNVPISPGRSLHLQGHIPLRYNGKIELKIRIAKIERNFLIYCGIQSELNVEELDQAIWDLQKPMLQGTEPEWWGFYQRHFQERKLNHLEKRYVDGFYTYLLGCHLETKGAPQAGQHFEEALGRLRPFSTMMALTCPPKSSPVKMRLLR